MFASECSVGQAMTWLHSAGVSVIDHDFIPSHTLEKDQHCKKNNKLVSRYNMDLFAHFWLVREKHANRLGV